MSRRPVMFIPLGFTIDSNTSIVFKDCKIFMHEGWNMLHANVFKDHFQGNVELKGWDIYTEENPITFLDKIESFTKQEERLV
ncbi:hypothetical protein ACIGIJ_18685 [Bacillus paranthracis]|uniref:hypothetical protein n=1 Tax=Bacillus paranthracis TaxID=2026186 RepID=UPI0037CAD727